MSYVVRRFVVPVAAVALTMGSLAACGEEETTAAPEAISTATSADATASKKATTTPSAPVGTALSLTKSWTKATDKKMTGSFGELKNTSAKDITLVSGASAAAGLVELHEVKKVDGKMKMQKVDGGLVVKAGETLELKPGGNHIMLMQLKQELKAGDKVAFSVTDKDGKEYSFTSEIRESDAEDEPYHDHGHGADKDKTKDKGHADGHDH